MSFASEDRLDALREEARRNGAVGGRGVDVSGGPIPRQPQPAKPGYAGEPVVRPPVWTWEIPLYFFIGGTAGMAATVGCAAWLFGRVDIAEAAFWIAAIGAFISPVLLIMDLGRPLMFYNMLRVFKIRSPMSMGAWILSAFGAHIVPGLVAFELATHQVFGLGILHRLIVVVAVLAVAGAGFWGLLLATYTGVLIGATVIPAWFLHRSSLPIHFGIVGLGSAVSCLELLGHRSPELAALGFFVAGTETVLWLLLESHRHGAADRSVHSGTSGWIIRIADLCTGPIALILRLCGLIPFSAISFVIGGLLSRFGWIEAGRACGRDPEAVFASQSR